jgi:divalent metal cation (Fe/Co/Zn/Cd) transporter
VLAKEMKPLLIGEAASDGDLEKITSALSSAPNVNSIIHLRTMHLGPDDLLLAAKVDFDHSLSMQQLAEAIDQAEVALRAAVPQNITIYIEPDIRRQPTT